MQWNHSNVSLVDLHDLWFINIIDSSKVHPSIGDWHISVLHKKIEERQSACQQNVSLIKQGCCYCPLRKFWLFYKQGWGHTTAVTGDTANITKDKSIGITWPEHMCCLFHLWWNFRPVPCDVMHCCARKVTVCLKRVLALLFSCRTAYSAYCNDRRKCVYEQWKLYNTKIPHKHISTAWANLIEAFQ